MSLLREPLVHFLLLGALVCGGAQLFGEDRQYEIDAGTAQRARLASTYTQQYGTPPTQQQLDSLLAQYVRSEILYREGLALGLDRGDEIVRRRIVQKIEFVNQDTAGPGEESEAELLEFFQTHRARYETEPTVTFDQLYFSPDVSGETDARERAVHALNGLQRGAQPAGADLFADGTRFAGVEPLGLERVFGDPAFVTAVFAAPVGSWAGPYRSGLGWHLVKLSARTAARPLELNEVRAQVIDDLRRDAQQRRNEAEFQRLAAKYRVLSERKPT